MNFSPFGFAKKLKYFLLGRECFENNEENFPLTTKSKQIKYL